MKDITHYFDSSKISNDTSVTQKKVTEERAKVDQIDILNKTDESKTKRKRNRVKIKITRRSDSATCNIIESSSNLVDKTPSPCAKLKKRTAVVNFKSSEKDLAKYSEIDLDFDLPSTSTNLNLLVKTDDESSHNSTSTTALHQTDSTSKDARKKSDNNNALQKEKNNELKMKQKEKTELAGKKGYLKRKIREEDASEIEKTLQKRKKMFTNGSIGNKEENPGDENIPENNGSTNLKQSYNLLNYFSKATSEQLERERLMKAKVTVTAEVHKSQDYSVSVSSSIKSNKKDDKRKMTFNAEKLQEKFDEILLIQSETLVLSPKNEKIMSSWIQKKPKWSMKIQLQLDSTPKSGQVFNDNENIYTPTAKSKLVSDYKQNERIPKIFLPMKNTKNDLNDFVEEKKMEKMITESIGESDHPPKACESNDSISQKRLKDIDCQIIKQVSLKRKSEKKLACLFAEKVEPDPESFAAKKLILQYNMQVKDNTNELKQTLSVKPRILPFPKISHINEYSVKENVLQHETKFPFKKNTVFELKLDLSKMKTVTNLYNKTRNVSENYYECIETDFSTFLSESESYYSDAQSLWKSISKLTQSENTNYTPRVRRRKTVRKDSINSFSSRNQVSNTWTDKYKPNSHTEIVGNEVAALKLKTWLDGWNLLKDDDSYSSSEEFYGSDCSSSSSSKNNQVAVLIGPHGSGKTATVYAIAQELSYKVLEVNASSKRPGKKILREFEEATKSHRVKKSNLKEAFGTKIETAEESRKISQNSLILMEDVDLIFEEDEGFVSATFQLASNTKRPIVMTLTNTCSHLSKLAPQQMKIEFQPVYGKRVETLFQVITFAETGCIFSRKFFEDLFQNGDLRRNLLQLQYLLLSGKGNIPHSSLAVNNLWKDMSADIYKPLNNDKAVQKRKIQNALDELAKYFDYCVIFSNLVDIEDPTCNLLDLKLEPSISSIENIISYSSLQNLGIEIGNWLNNKMKDITFHKTQTLSYRSQGSKHFLSRKAINREVNYVLSQIVSNTLNQRALAVDYLSSIRTICRAEEIRNQLNGKRGNRFFHYLQVSKFANGLVKSSNFLSAACKMLCERRSFDISI